MDSRDFICPMLSGLLPLKIYCAPNSSWIKPINVPRSVGKVPPKLVVGQVLGSLPSGKVAETISSILEDEFKAIICGNIARIRGRQICAKGF